VMCLLANKELWSCRGIFNRIMHVKAIKINAAACGHCDNVGESVMCVGPRCPRAKRNLIAEFIKSISHILFNTEDQDGLIIPVQIISIRYTKIMIGQIKRH